MRFCSTTTRPPLADQVAFHLVLLPAFEPGYGRSCTDTSRPTNAPPQADNSRTPRSISCAANPPRTGTASATPHLGGTEYLHILLIVSWLNPKTPHRLTPAVSLNEHKTSNRSINLHNKYPRPPPPSQSRERSAKKVESFTLPRDSTMPSLRGRQLLCRVHRDIHPN
jgi:hypothetical protein